MSCFCQSFGEGVQEPVSASDGGGTSSRLAQGPEVLGATPERRFQERAGPTIRSLAGGRVSTRKVRQ